MTQHTDRARRVAAMRVATFALLLVAACDWKNELLAPQNPGIIDNSAVGSPAAAAALKAGAIGKLKNLVNCGGNYECLWEEAGNLADEYKNSDFQNDRQDIDQRQITSNNGILSYSTITQIRGFIRQAIDAERQYEPTKTSDIGELYVALGFVEMSMAENYCNGIPLGHTDNGNVVLGGPLTNAQVYDTASAHLDTALAIATGSDAGSVFVRQAALITKARILVDKGQFAAAAALVPTSAVPSTYQYVWTTSSSNNADDLGIWVLNNSIARITVSDSFDIVNGAKNVIKNALPFASAGDPRVAVLSGLVASPPVAPEDAATPMFVQQMWKGRDDPIPMVSGIDARLIEAEGKLNASDFAGMMTILNALRAAAPKIGNFQPGAMQPLAIAPATKDAAATLFFREKAFWTFGRGQRLGDLRRLIRQYGRTQDNVFPTGLYFKGGSYGNDVNFPVPDTERPNPLFNGCLDRNA
jgi:hypothetical protein